MNRLTKWLVASAALALVAAPVLAGDAIQRGTVKTTMPDKNEFVLEHDGKTSTIALGDNLIVNRDGKDVKFADVKTGDDLSVGYDKGVLKWTAQYILVHNKENATYELGRGTVKAWDADKGNMQLVDLNNKEWTFHMPADSRVQVNADAKKMADIKLGEMVWLTFTKDKDGKLIAHSVIAQRK